MIPVTALVVPTYLLFAWAQLTDTSWAIIVPSLVSPFGVHLMRVYAADAVDYSLIEAARVDGAGEIRTFFQVAFGLLVPGAIAVLLISPVITGSLIAIVPLVLAFLFLQRFWQSGLARGGVKGLIAAVLTPSPHPLCPPQLGRTKGQPTQ